MTRLYGRICEPSMAARGVASWIASLAATRASPSPSPGGAGARTIPATCGRTSRGSSASAARNGCFWRTSPIISTSAIGRSDKSWKTWATGLRKDCSRRRKLARRIFASGSSCWPTPNVSGGGNPPEILIRKGNHFVRPSGKKAHFGLDQAARMWPTPTASCATGASNAGRAGGPNIQTAASLWAMPMWATPKACDGTKPSAGKRKGCDLTHQSKRWPTPAARDAKGANSKRHVREAKGRAHMDQLANYAVHSRPARTISKAGGTTSAGTRVLNPLFAEALMGWPTGWTDVRIRLNAGRTGCASPETAWSLWWRRMHGALSRLDSIRMMHEPES